MSREVNCQTRHRADCKDGSELNGFINLDWLTAHPFHPPRRRAQRKDRMKEKKDFASVDLLFGRYPRAVEQESLRLRLQLIQNPIFEGSVCKVRTQNPENFDEIFTVTKSLVSSQRSGN